MDDHRYEFVFGYGTAGAGRYFASEEQRVADDNRAKRHGAFALRAPHLMR